MENSIRVGIDIGGTDIKAALTDTNFEIILKRKIPFPQKSPYQETVRRIARLIFDMCAEVSAPPLKLASVGVALPGILDEQREVLKFACNLGWENVPIKAETKKHFPKLPVYVENDANAAVIAEFESGALAGCKNAVLLTLGTGVGSGVILDGKLFRGESGSSPEVGHIALFQDGTQCSCGKKGCIETLCSASYLAREGQKALTEFPLSLISIKAKKDGKVNAQTVIDSAREGDAAAINIFDRYIDSLSRAVVFCDIFKPQTVALGGGVSRAGEFLFSALLKRIKEMTGKPFRVIPARFENDAGVLGAAMLYKYD